MIQRRTLIQICMSGLLVSACGGPTFIVQQYDGPPRSPETIAILRVQGNEPVQLVTLDGARADAVVDEDVRLHLELLPGAHRVGVADKRHPELGVHRIAFRAAAGAVYRVVFATTADVSQRARIYEVGRDSNVLVRDVTLAIPDPGVAEPLPAP